MITDLTVLITAANPAQALDRALNKIDRMAQISGQVVSIETYTVKRVDENRYQITFS